MSYPINYPTPQNANVQIFRGGDANTTAHVSTRAWVKPQGASFVWFTLIGAGGGGGGNFQDSGGPQWYPGGSGASGNVTNFMCPAFLLPDMLQVAVGKGGTGGADAVDTAASDGLSGESTQIIYQQKNGIGYQLLLATGGGGGGGANFGVGAGGAGQAGDQGGPMTAAGFYNSTDGTNGIVGGNTTGYVNTTFLMGGNGDSSPATVITGHYGYTATNASGYSQLSPIPITISRTAISQAGGKASSQSFGCGGSGGGIQGVSTGYGGNGGDGLAIIVTW